MAVKFPCKICEKAVAGNHRVVCCNICNIWVHIKCNRINTQTYIILKKENASWSCIECSKSVFPFSKLDNTNFLTTSTGKNLKYITVRKKHSTQEGILIDRINDALNTSDLENSSTYFNVDEFNEHFDANTFNVFNAFHLNISSLSYKIDQLSTILNSLKVQFDILGIIESRLRTDKQTKNNIDLEGYVIDSTPNPANCGGALLYINKSINFKMRNDLKIYKYKELESAFIEIINRKGKML